MVSPDIIRTIDVGSTNYRRSAGYVNFDDELDFYSAEWVTAVGSRQRIPGFRNKVNMWNRDVAAINFESIVPWLRDAYGVDIGVTGSYRRQLIISDSYGLPLIGLTTKTVFPVKISPDIKERLKPLGVVYDWKDKTNPLLRFATVISNLDKFAAESGIPKLTVGDLYVEPAISAYIRLATGLRYGFHEHEWKPWIGGDYGWDVAHNILPKVMEAMGLLPHQYDMRQHRVLQLPNGKTARGAGDYQMKVMAEHEIISSGLEVERAVYIEADTICKLAYYGTNDYARAFFPDYNVYGKHKKINGASVNTDILFPLWTKELHSFKDPNDWFAKIDEWAGEGVVNLANNRFFFIPEDMFPGCKGGIYDESGKPYSWSELASADIQTKIEVTAAVYCGLGRHIAMRLPLNIDEVYISGGLMQETQQNKGKLLAAGLSDKVKRKWLQLPNNGDTGIIAGIEIARERGYKINLMDDRLTNICDIDDLDGAERYRRRSEQLYKTLGFDRYSIVI